MNYLKPNHQVLATVDGTIFADIVSEHYTAFFAKRALARILKNKSEPATGIKYLYQKNSCF